MPTARTDTTGPIIQDMEPIDRRFRRQMPIADRWAYFDHAAVSPLPKLTWERMARFAEEAATGGDTHWPDWARELEDLRCLAARMIGASPDEIALLKSTTEGINLVSQGLDWRVGDNVVTLADEFPSNVYPWLQLADRGVETRLVPTQGGRLDLDELAAVCDERTRVVSVSWVGFQSGYRHDLAVVTEIAHRAGALCFVDAIQGLGIYPLDVRAIPIDFLAADGHKWMLGPEGAGLAYVRSEHLASLRPACVGWNSVARPYDFSRIDLTYKPSAGRFEGGSANMVGHLALRASLGLLTELGTAAIERQIVDYTDQVCETLSLAGANLHVDRDRTHRQGEQRSGIVFFDWPGHDPNAVREHCLRAGVVLSCRGGRLRVAAHAYNNRDDLERLVAALRRFGQTVA